MIKHIIFSDVDGTIYGQDHIIDQQTIKDINKAQEIGVEFVLCTGNAVFRKQSMVKLAQKLSSRYIVCSNGASIFDLEKDEFIYTSFIPKIVAKKISNFANKNKISGDWWDTKKLYSNKFATTKLVSLVSNAMLYNDKIIKSKKIDNDILKIEFFDEKDKIDIAQIFCDKLNLQIARMKPNHIEITQVGVSKGHGIEILCDMLGVDILNTMGIGDSANDLGMFEVVGHSYAMDNASLDIKEKAMHYTSGVFQNGLGEAIIDYLHRTKLDR